MTTNWLQGSFASPVALASGDYLVGVTAGGACARFDTTALLLSENNLDDVASAITAFNNIAPTTTQGDIIYRGASNNSRLGIGTNNQVLTSNGTVPGWSSTLTGLTLAGTITASGTLAVTGVLSETAANGITAHAGGGQGSATLLTGIINRITTVATLGDSAIMPPALAGQHRIVINAANTGMDLFPAVGEQIDQNGANTPINIAGQNGYLFYCAVDGFWNGVQG